MIPETIIGCDPEVIWDMYGTSYAGMLPAGIVLNRLQKVGNPMITGDYKGYPCIQTSHGLIFGDGAGWELNPNPGTVPQVVANIRELLATSQKVRQALSTVDRQIELKIVAAMRFSLEMLVVWGDEQLTQFGCDPDKSIWPRDVNPSDIHAVTHPFRYFGGHIHLGYPLDGPVEFYKDMNNLKRMIALADGTIGLAGIVLDRVNIGAAARRKVYGQPGVYRPQPHGIEYRTTSNSWLLSETYATRMLSLAAWLPALFETDLPDYILENQSEALRRALILGGHDKAGRMLGDHIAHVTHGDAFPELAKLAKWFLARATERYPVRPDWEPGWGLL